jgi:hypothetical protein
VLEVQRRAVGRHVEQQRQGRLQGRRRA